MTEIPGMVERRHCVAKAIYEKNHHNEWPGGLSLLEREVFYRCADAAIAAHEAALRDAGYAIVPVEPTPEMLAAFEEQDVTDRMLQRPSWATEIWATMLAAYAAERG